MKDFFYNSNTERKAIFILLFFILILVILGWLWPWISQAKKKDFSAFKAEILAFESDMILSELEEEESRKSKYSNKYNYSDSRKRKSDKNGEEPISVLSEPFPFDPNSADEQTFIKLGLQKRTVRSILNFREKGGKFRTKSDFAKIYSWEDIEYERLSEFIQLPDSLEKKLPAERKFEKKPKELPSATDVNTARAEDFQKLPGIGPSFAERIVKYRNSMGGFVKIEQMADVYGFPDSTYQKISPYLRCSASAVKKININTATAEELKTHPYIKWKHANAIVKYRTANGPYKSVETLRTIQEFDDAEGTYWKIKPYLSI